MFSAHRNPSLRFLKMAYFMLWNNVTVAFYHGMISRYLNKTKVIFQNQKISFSITLAQNSNEKHVRQICTCKWIVVAILNLLVLAYPPRISEKLNPSAYPLRRLAHSRLIIAALLILKNGMIHGVDSNNFIS
jgi:hypothetical protein